MTTIDIGNPVAMEAMPFLSPSFGITAPTTLPQPRPKKRRNYNPNKARDERKRELQYVRNEVDELGFKLEHLQAVKADKALCGDEILGSQLASGLPLLESPGPNHFVWEQTCVRQLNCRLRSECENIHLKLLLKKQIQVAKSMEKLLNKHMKLTAAETSGSNNKRTIRVHVSREDNVVEDVIVYEELNISVESRIEPLEFSNKKLAGIRYREKGYVIIKPHNVSEASDDEAYTLVQTCCVITPDLSDQRLSDNNKTGALTEFVLSTTVDNISASTDMIENLLVDQELQQRSCI
ncbi:hypothetical protein BBI17_004797 [Phytophthora kernoviae]|uniref:Uncharacterized protein n=1 Tax=Phytophthora kernoviae TaxID=325452 RepID=A0A3R7J8Y7_9STRA|nr:hypothetical protein BBI17_004797 [Phytophthora kernoviae]